MFGTLIALEHMYPHFGGKIEFYQVWFFKIAL